MRKISCAGYRFPPEVVHKAIWLYHRFTLSFRDVEDLLAERGIAISYETVRRWVNHFRPHGLSVARRRRRERGPRRASPVQANKHAALKLMRKLLKKCGFVPDRLITDDLRSYSAAAHDLGTSTRHERGRRSRVDDWRSGCRSRGVAVRRQLSHIAGASIRTVAPFPVAARQTGRADFPHPAFSRPIKSSLLAGRCGFAGRCRGRASHKDTRPGSGRTRCLCVPIAVATSDGFVARCIYG